MPALVDTSVLVPLANAADPRHLTAVQSVDRLHRKGEILNIAPQNLIEFWNVATRPAAVNGIGLPPIQAKSHVDAFAKTFFLLDESPAIFPAWLTLVDTLGVIGKQVHDARLVAVCQVSGIDKILTFNVSHFTRLTASVHAIVVLDPATV